MNEDLFCPSLEPISKSKVFVICLILSFPCRRESSVFKVLRIPAFAGMTAFSETTGFEIGSNHQLLITGSLLLIAVF